MRTLLASAAVLTLGLSGAALAQTPATASTDLNVRSGPGVNYPVVGLIGAGVEVSVVGCIEAISWCEVSTPVGGGWSYGDYLMVAMGDTVVPLYPNLAQVGVAVVPAPAAVEPSVVEYTTVGRLSVPVVDVSTPVAPVATTVATPVATPVVAIQPAPEVTTYVTTNVVDPVYLDGEVVLGAVIPETVQIYDIPSNPDYGYVLVNGQTVLVDPVGRDIVYVYR